MAIEFSCPRCDKQYSVPDAMGGKRARCKACGQERTIPQPASAPQLPAAPTVRPASTPRLPAATQPSSTPRLPSAPIQSGRPRLDHVIEDFEEVDEVEEAEEVEEFREVVDFEEEEAAPPSRRRKAEDLYDEAPRFERPSFHLPWQPWRVRMPDFRRGGIYSIFFGLILVSFVLKCGLAVTGAMPSHAANALFLCVVGLACFSMLIIGDISLILIAFGEGFFHGICFLFTPYWIYFLFSRWDQTKQALATAATGAVTFVVVVVICLATNGLEGVAALEQGPGHAPATASHGPKTEYYRKNEEFLSEYARALEELHSSMSGVNSEGLAGMVEDRINRGLQKIDEFPTRLRDFGKPGPGDDERLRDKLGGRLRKVLIQVHEDAKRLEQFPLLRASMANLEAETLRVLIAFDGSPPWKEGDTPPVLLAGGASAAGAPAIGGGRRAQNPLMPGGSDTINRSLLQLEGEGHSRMEAVQRLGRSRPNERREEVVAALLPLLDDDDGFLVVETVRTLAIWHTPAVVPRLIDHLSDNRSFVRHETIKALGKIKDPQALEPLMGRFDEDQFQVADALKEFGPAAEPALIPLLKAPNAGRRQEALRILKEVGGMDTLITMRDLPTDPDGLVRMFAQDAWQAIVARVGPPPAAPRKDKSPFAPKRKSK